MPPPTVLAAMAEAGDTGGDVARDAGGTTDGDGSGRVHDTPSGAAATLYDIIRDPGPAGDPAGGVWRFRFLMPALADRVAPYTGAHLDGITDEDVAELDSLGLPATTGPFSAEGFDSAELVTIEQLEAEGAIDSTIIIDLGDAGTGAWPDAGPALPADPSVLLQDPLHADLVWLCEQVALPALPAPGDTARPGLIIISLSDRPVRFGEIDMQAVQIFEGFSPADDGRTCRWEPW